MIHLQCFVPRSRKGRIEHILAQGPVKPYAEKTDGTNLLLLLSESLSRREHQFRSPMRFAVIFVHEFAAIRPGPLPSSFITDPNVVIRLARMSTERLYKPFTFDEKWIDVVKYLPDNTAIGILPLLA